MDSRPKSAGASPLADLSRSRGPIAFTYALSFFENLLELSYPWAIGVAVNGLIVGEPSLVWPLVAIWLTHIAVGFARQRYDTRLFARLNARMAERMVAEQRSKGAAVSEVSARVEMVDELVSFLEEDVPVLLATLIGLLGSVVLLAFYDLVSGAVMLGLLVPIVAINFATGLRAFRNNVDLNSTYERQVEVIAELRPRRWSEHFTRMAELRVRLSDLDALSWSLGQLFTLGAVVYVLFRAASVEGAMAGDVFAALAYALRIEQSIGYAPAFAQQLGRLLDIRERIRGGAE